MKIEQFFPAVLRDYLYTGTFHMRPKLEFETRYMDVIMTLGNEAVMTCPCNMHLLNAACRNLEDGEIYLEIGCYRGSTLIGALLDNEARAVAVDDRSEPVHPDGRDDQQEFERHLRIFGMEERVSFYQMKYQEYYERVVKSSGSVGAFFLDGFASSSDEVYQMITGALPLLASRAVIILDDANMEKTQAGAERFLREHGDKVRLLMAQYTPEMQMHPKFPTWWNGAICMAWEA